MTDKKSFYLLSLIIISTALFTILGIRWRIVYYSDESLYSPSNPPLASAMRGLRDGLPALELSGLAKQPETLSSLIDNDTRLIARMDLQLDELTLSAVEAMSAIGFTTAGEDYFDDACFIGDSRTVGISNYAGIENAVFLCKNSFTIYDYDKEAITYNDKKTSVKEILSDEQFGKIYLMVGINECGTGTPESFFKEYSKVVSDIQSLQPNALIFIQANLLVTEEKSNEDASINNENITARNKLIATLANGTNIFYIDINESILCEGGSLIGDYTWDQVHIRAQYYPLWKEFLLEHAISK